MTALVAPSEKKGGDASCALVKRFKPAAGPTNGRTTRPNFLGQIDPSVLTVVRKGICHCTLSKVG